MSMSTPDRLRAGEHAFSAVAALLFFASAAMTIVWCRSSES